MSKPNETPAPESKNLLPSEKTSASASSSTVAREGQTRKGHSNGLRVHSIVFGSISLGVLVVLVVALLVIAGSRMM